MGRGAEVAQRSAGAAREDGGEPELLTGVGRGVERVDAGVEAVKAPGGNAILRRSLAQSGVEELGKDYEVLLPTTDLGDPRVDLSTSGR
jgi:hypothetical protein